MRNMRSVLLLFACSMFAAEPLTNETIARMAAAKIPEPTIIETIRNAESVSFKFTPADTDWLSRQGVSEAAIKEMAARSTRLTQVPEPAKPTVSNAVQPTQPPTQERPDHWGMTPGMPEVAIGGGAGMLLTDLGDIPDVVTGVVSLDGGIGINRYVAGIGSITRHSRGGGSVCTTDECFTGSATFDEFLAGIRLSASNRTRVTPFFTGQLGAARLRADLSDDEDRVFGSIWNPAGALGGGVEVNATRNIGFRGETRFLRTIDAGWIGRANFSVFFRFGR